MDRHEAEEILTQHAVHPRNRRSLVNATHRASGTNPLCGDRVEIQLAVDADQITEAAFSAKSCALCVASASILTVHLVGKSTAEADRSIDRLRTALRGGEADLAAVELIAVGSLSRNPARVACVALPWEVLRSALMDAELPGKQVPEQHDLGGEQHDQ